MISRRKGDDWMREWLRHLVVEIHFLCQMTLQAISYARRARHDHDNVRRRHLNASTISSEGPEVVQEGVLIVHLTILVILH